MIMIDIPLPEKCNGCIFCDDTCNCIASDHDGVGINVGCAYRTGERDIRCPLKELIKCKDCKHGQCEEWNNGEYTDRTVYCDGYGIHNPDWFCADCEQKQ